jgi:N-acetylglutamate synthase-like GNAT family acetyltransferase
MLSVLYQKTKNPIYCHHFQLQKQDNVYLNFMYLSIHLKPATSILEIQYDTDIIGYVEFYTDDETDEANVSCINVNPNMRGKGFAYYLFLKMIEYLKQININTVTLDDDSDRYKQPNNLYIKLGFKYVSNSGPEMYGEMINLSKKINYEKAKKYDWYK